MATNAAKFTHADPATPYGQGRPKSQRGAAQPLTQTTRPSLGNNDPGRVADFLQGARASEDARLKTATAMVAVYAGIKAWSAWRRAHPRP